MTPPTEISQQSVTSQADGLFNPRLSDVFGLIIRQDEADFVVPHLQEDLRLYLDPFLLWKSDSSEYQELHWLLLGFIDQIRLLALSGNGAAAHRLLAEVREPEELGLGYASGTKRGSAIGQVLRAAIIETFRQVPQLEAAGLDHLEILALLVPKVAEDRISDLTASVIKRWLAEFTTRRCKDFEIPTNRYRLTCWDGDQLDWRSFTAQLPYNPDDRSPILLAPLDLLRRLPWINYADYYKSTYSQLVLPAARSRRVVPKETVLAFNRAHYEVIRGYVQRREEEADECAPDPLFTPLRFDTLKRKASQLHALPTGSANRADKQFEGLAFELLASLLYPELDLAGSQERTISGAHIRDIIFHNDGKTPFLRGLLDQYTARQVVVELKNVAALGTEHVNQLYRYLDGESIGSFGILLTRNPPARNVQRNIVDLHSSKRAAIICLDDSDIELMIQLLDAHRRPMEALRKKVVEFTRSLPQ